MRILDTHLHLWDPARLTYPWLEGVPALNRQLAAPQAIAAMDHAGLRPGAGVESIFMQADCLPEQSIDEVAWVTSERERVGLRGIVAFAPVELPQLGEHLDALAAYELVVGVRRLLQGEPAGFAMSEAFVAGVKQVAERGLVFDACVTREQLPEVAALADAVPELSIVLDHLGKPAVGSAAAPQTPAQTWERHLRGLAQRPNVTCKVSGLPGESNGAWSETQLTPFLDTALDAFGAERLMFASDWGASFGDDIEAGYGRWLEFVSRWAGAHSDQVLGLTGARVYLGED
ncbi:amidohydrolase family protein [Leucobacter sp. HY1910]